MAGYLLPEIVLSTNGGPLGEDGGVEKPKTGLLKHKKNKTVPESAEMKAKKRERTMADMTKGILF